MLAVFSPPKSPPEGALVFFAPKRPLVELLVVLLFDELPNIGALDEFEAPKGLVFVFPDAFPVPKPVLAGLLPKRPPPVVFPKPELALPNMMLMISVALN